MVGEGKKRFRAKYAAEWDEIIKSKKHRRQRGEIRKRCAAILIDPHKAHRAHPWGDEWMDCTPGPGQNGARCSTL